MKHLTLVALSFFLLSSILHGQIVADIQTIKKMVVFIYPASADGTVDKDHPLGTGFVIAASILGHPPSMRPDGKWETTGHLLLLTARHIVHPNWANCSFASPSRIYLRLNLKAYDPKNDATGVDYQPIDLVKNGSKKYLVRDDDATVDGAVKDVTDKLSQEKDDFEPMELSSFGTPEEIRSLQEGDDILSAGLIPNRSGEKRNYPSFKFGHSRSSPTRRYGCHVGRAGN